MRKLLILVAMVTLLASLAQAQEYSITLDDPTGVSNEGTIDIGTTVQFPLRWNVDGAIGGGRIAGFTNGFHVYSPGGGARWGNIVASMNPTYINAGTYVIFADTVYRPDGITPDTISFSGVSFGTGLQIPAGGFSGQVFFISVDIPNDPTIHNSVFCLDSVPSFPPTNNWKWSDGLVPANDIFPTFSGPHCYTIVDPSAPTNQAPVIGNLPDTAVTEGETLALTVTATDPDGTTPSLAALQLPAGATFDDNGDGTGSFSWVTEIGDAGVYTAIFEASDGELNDADTVQITVNALPPAVLVVEPLSFSFTAVEGGDNPGTQTLAIEEATARAVPFTVSKTNDWLTLSATDGTTPSSIQVGVDIIGLPADVYDDVIVVRSPDTEDSILVPVTLTVTAAPQFVLSPDTLYFSGVVGGDNPAGQDVLVAVEGDLAVDVTLSPLAAYIAVDPADLTTPALSSVTVDISALAEGDYFDSILVSEIAVANKDAEQIADAYVYVVTTISAAPEYILSPDTLYFTGEEGGDSPDAQDVSIAVTGDLAIATLLSTAAPYITVDPLNLTTPGVTSVSVDISTLVEGTYIDSILVAEAVPEPQEKDIEQTADAYIYVVTTILPPPPTTALVQIIHNAAGPALETVDVWVNDSLLLDNFTFRTATPFVSLPAEEQLLIEVSAFDDPTPLAIFDVTLAENQTYVFVANGVLEPAGFQANPDGVNITFTMYSIANARQVAANDSTVEFASLHGATDAPTVDITARGVATLLDDITYGEFVFYQSVPTASYILDVADSTSILASFTADLSSLGGSAAVVFASGFLTPADDQNGAPFGLFAALPNGTVIEFPPYEEPCTELLLQDSVFAFVAPQGGPATPESALLYVFGSIPGSDFDFSISGPTNDSVVSFFNATTSDSGSTVSGSAGDSIFIYVNTMSLSVGIYAFPYVVSSTDENVCEPASRDFAVLVTINEVIVPSDDTVRVVTVPAVPGMRVTVPVNFVNSCPVSMLHTQLVFNPTALYIDSVSLDASRVADEINTFNVDNNAGTLSLMTEADGGLIDIGSGNWVNLFVTVKCEAPGGFYGFVLDTSAGAENPMFVRDCGLGAEIEQTEYVGGGIVVDTVSNYVCGFVVDTAGTAIEGATVQLWGSFPFGAPLDQRFSSELGSFGFGNFTTVPFALYAFADGYYPALAENLNFGDKGIMLVLTPLPELTPTSQWVDYYCGTNTYRGQPLPIGSVVEAWVSDRGLLVGRQIVIEAGSYSFMTVYRANDQFGDDGALTGDMISFFVNGMPAIADGDVIYPAEYAEVQVCLAVGDVITQECTLQEGWNLVSWRIDTESDDLETVLGPYMDNIDVILGFERGGLTYDPDLTQFSTLWDVDHLSGYWIRVKDGMGFTLAIEGTAVPVSTPIPVTTGWNLVSYLPEMTMAPADALISLDGILLWAYGYDGGILTYSPTMPQFNTLTEMAACNGYWVKVSGNGTLVYPGASPVAFTSSYILPYESYGGRASLPTALAGRVSPTTEWVNLYSSNVTLDGASVTPGSRIEAFTADGKLVGSFDVVQPGTFGFMPVYGKTSDAEIGVEAGQSFYLEIDGARTNETFVWTGNGERIEVGALTSQSAGNNTVPETYSLAQNYPNPFNPSTVISFTMPSAGQARIDVFNILGHKVATVYDGMAAAGTTEVVWDGRAESGETVSSGVYFYRLTTDTFTDTKKMMLLK